MLDNHVGQCYDAVSLSDSKIPAATVELVVGLGTHVRRCG